MGLWMAVLGAGVLAFAVYDALATTVATDRGGGPLTARLGDGWARLVRGAVAQPRSRLLASLGSTVVLLTLGTWLALLWLGWTLVFSADTAAVVSSAGSDPADWWARVYFAGFTVFTLGVGDYVPGGAGWQLLTVVATVSGLGLTTLAITYLVPVVSAVNQRRAYADLIAGLGAGPGQIVVAAWDHGAFGYFEQLLAQLTPGLLLTSKRHLTYPVLDYFHPSAPQHDLRVQVPLLDDALHIIELGVDAPEAHPSMAAVHTARWAIRQLIERGSEGHAEGSSPPSPSLEPLRRAGISVVDDATFDTRLAAFGQHRRAVAAFSAESKWVS